MKCPNCGFEVDVVGAGQIDGEALAREAGTRIIQAQLLEAFRQVHLGDTPSLIHDLICVLAEFLDGERRRP